MTRESVSIKLLGLYICSHTIITGGNILPKKHILTFNIKSLFDYLSKFIPL